MKGILLYVASVCPFNGSIVIFWKIHILKCALWQHRPDGQSLKEMSSSFYFSLLF